MKPAALFLGLILAITAFAQFGLQEAALSPIASSEIDWVRQSGINIATGLALINDDGMTHTCAGQSANLIPGRGSVDAHQPSQEGWCAVIQRRTRSGSPLAPVFSMICAR